MDSNISQSQLQFTTSTGMLVEQLFTPLYFKVPGKVYPSMSLSRKQSHSLLTYARKLLSFLLSIELKQLLSSLTFRQRKTLHSAYRQESLAILSNSQDLHAAICKAQEYNIPLLHVIILTEAGETAVKERMLVNFAISHFINQNFVLYGDWEVRKEVFDSLGEQEPRAQHQTFDAREGIYFRRGELIYAFISLEKVATAHEHTLQENLTKVRNMFYLLETEPRQPEPEVEFSPEPSSELQPNLSQFGAMGVHSHLQHQQNEEFIDNFNDSDNQMELQP